MRIIVNGQQAFGRAVLDALLERGEDVVGVFTAPDQEGGRPDPAEGRRPRARHCALSAEICSGGRLFGSRSANLSRTWA